MLDFAHDPASAELARRLNFSFVLPGRLAGLGWPFLRNVSPQATAELLRTAGVAVLVNLTGEPYPHAARSALAALRLVDIPVNDYTPPTLKQANELWALFSALPAGQVLAIHCAAGVGRTGTLLACLLGRERGLSAEEAVSQLRLLRPPSVETLEQEEFVAEWLLHGQAPGCWT